MNYIKTYLNSFKNKNILVVSALNISFILITVIFIQLIKLISKPWIEKMNNVNLSNLITQTETQLQAIITTLKGFVLFTLFTALIFTILTIINWSFFQGIIYNILLKKKFTMNFYKKFLILNIIWFIPWLIIFSIILFGSKLTAFITPTFILALLFLHFTFILYTKNKLKIRQALKLGITKIHYFILPYILIAITFIIISQLNIYKSVYFFIVYIIFFSWVQNYTKDIILSISKKC